MPIIGSEIKAYKSTTVNDTGSNGGRLSSVEIVSAQVGALFPNATPAERTSGAVKYRKMFWKVANDADLTLSGTQFYQDKNTAGDDRVIWFVATQRNAQSAITGSERKYGIGKLKTTVSSGVTTFDVTVEDGAVVLFVNGDKIRVTNKENLADAGDEEFVTISGVPTVVGNDVTIVFTPALSVGYLSADTRIMPVYEPGEIKCITDNTSVTSGAGTYNFGTYPVVNDNIGTVEQTWTLTFTNATSYGIVGDTIGSVGTGNVSGGASPVNPAFSKPYFTLQPGGFGGTFTNGDTIVFQTHPAALPIWVRQVIPAGAGVAAASTASFILTGETP